MKKRFFYEFSGNVFLETDDQAEAESLIKGILLDHYLIDEELHEIDENYVSFDLEKRKLQWGTDIHPFHQEDEFYEFKIRQCRYGDIFDDFINGKFDKGELLKRMDEAEKTDIADLDLIDELSMIDIESKEMKTVRHLFVE